MRDQHTVDLPSDVVALETADDLSPALLPSAVRLATYSSLVRRSRRIRARQTMYSARLASRFATAVETVPDNLTGGSFDGRDSAETHEGSLASQPLGVVPSYDQQRRGVVGTDAYQRDRLWSDLRYQLIELCVY